MQAAGEALEAWVRACADRRAYGDYVLLRELLRGYDARYAEAKERESAVDFDDLELLTCRLLEENPSLQRALPRAVRARPGGRVPGHEPLQIRLLGLLTGDDGRLFTVGDEFQSIYGFRHADVGVFREMRDEAAERGPRAGAQARTSAAGRRSSTR